MRTVSASILLSTCAILLLAVSPAAAQTISGPGINSSNPVNTQAIVQQPVANTAPINTSASATTVVTPEGGAQTVVTPAGQPTPADIVTAAQPLPGSTDQPPAESADDPLAQFRRANQQPAANPAVDTPVPTPGGFQQPADGSAAATLQAAQDYSLQAPTAEMLEERAAENKAKAQEQAFDSALNGMMPLSPEQIGTLLEKYRQTRQVSESRIGGTPRPEVVVQTISLDPGVTPPVIKLSPGHVTSVDVLDITGQPWPVQDVSWGGNFEVISPGEGGHIIRISPMAATEVGNMSVQLLGLKTPVTFTLETQLDVVQYRFDARIPEYGPNASTPIIDPGVTIEAGSDKTLTQILDGSPPAGAEKLTVSGADGRTAVYKVADTTYLRTPLTLLSPGWSASVKSADGTTVYVVNNSPVFLLSDRGKMIRAAVQEHSAPPNPMTE